MSALRVSFSKVAVAVFALVLALGLIPVSAFAAAQKTEGDELVAGTLDVLAVGSKEGSCTTNVYTVDTQGSYVETSSIATALKAAGADPSDGPADQLYAQAASGDGFVIVLDPGHGGYDSGANGYGLQEKVVNLKIAQYCKAKLEQTPGVTVYMTRYDDTYVGLSERTQFAINHGADLVVSIHNNAGGGRGSEVIVPNSASWLYDKTYMTGRELGQKILGALNSLGLSTHNGVYSRDNTVGAVYPDGSLSDYYSLVNGPRYNGILGIIVEHAFIDNGSDVAWLNNDINLKKLGEADANAIIQYYDSSAGLERLYWGIYDYSYYTSHYADVKAQYGSSKVQALGYFKKLGMAAGQRANVLFDVNYYKANNADLQQAYGDNLAKYYMHFLKYGMSERRQGSADFNVRYYKANYADLRAAFGSDWASYYKHYVQYGMNEGRVATRLLDGAKMADSVFRLYNSNNGDHHYTLSITERDVLRNLGWTYEGTAWDSPDSDSKAKVYRLYNPNSGDHHYTTDANEKDVLQQIGWTYEGVSWYSEDSFGIPLYRLYNKWLTAGTHHYTASINERNELVRLGWIDEGIAWYGA